MKKTGAISVILCLFLVFALLAVPVKAEEQNAVQSMAVSNGCHSTDAKLAVLGNQKILDNASAAFLYEANSNTLLYAWNADIPLAPASFVKIMTALLAIERGTLADVITVKENVLNSVPGDAVSADLQPNEVLTLEELLYCMIVGSANDAAAVIADHISGSQTAFVQLMNQRAEDIGCTGTVFTNAHGLHDKAQITTARDTAKILDEAQKNETFAKIFGTVAHTVPETNKSAKRELVTRNYMMNTEPFEIYYDERVIGGRTGEANDGSRCFAAVAESNGMRLISVVMGSASVYEEDGYTVKIYGGFAETKQLLDAVATGYKTVQILYSGQILGQSTVVGGNCDVNLGCTTDVSTVVPEHVTIDQLVYRNSDINASLSAPLDVGVPISYVEVWYGNLCLAQAELTAMNKVDSVGSLLQSREKQSVRWWIILLILLAVVVVLVLILVGYRVVRRFNIRADHNRSRRYRASRRRSR